MATAFSRELAARACGVNLAEFGVVVAVVVEGVAVVERVDEPKRGVPPEALRQPPWPRLPTQGYRPILEEQCLSTRSAA
jgi:hypothetical protein